MGGARSFAATGPRLKELPAQSYEKYTYAMVLIRVLLPLREFTSSFEGGW